MDSTLYNKKPGIRPSALLAHFQNFDGAGMCPKTWQQDPAEE